MQDILLDDTGDLKIENGDIAVGESWAQSVQLTLNASPGHFKNAPMIGVRFINAKNGILDNFLLQKIGTHLKAAGLSVSAIDYNETDIQINE